MADRRRRPVPELDERDLEGVPIVALSLVLALFDQIEGLRPLTAEEQSTQAIVAQVRDGRNQLVEERFGRGSTRAPRYVPPGQYVDPLC